MEDNESKPTNVLDMIATDAKPAEITDTLKTMIYAKAGERLEYLKPYAAAAVFGGEPPEDSAEEPTAELETEVETEEEPQEDA